MAGAGGNATFSDAEAASNLCVQCGLCCNGSLFSEVELASDEEAADLEPHGLNVEDGDEDEPAVLNQPCGALCGSRCTIYAQRPECCRTFECKLLKDFKRGLVSRDTAAARIDGLRRQLQAIGKLLDAVNASADLPLQERYYEAQELLAAKNDARDPRSEDLAGRMNAIRKTLREQFLGL